MNDIQKEMLIQMQLSEDSKDTMYCQQEIYTFNYIFDHEKIKDSVETIIRRHPTLRSTITLSNGFPEQVFYKKSNFSYFRKINESSGAPFKKLCMEERLKVSGTDKDCMFSILVYQKTDNTTEFVVTYNHLILDGLSCDIVLHEIFESYFDGTLFAEENTEFMKLMSGERKEDKKRKEIEFWSKYLKTISPFIISDYAKNLNSLDDKNAIVNKEVKFQSGFRELKESSRKHGVTINSLILTALLDALKSIYSIDKPCLGLVVSNQNFSAKKDDIIGCTVRTLPFSASISETSYKNAFEIQEQMFSVMLNSNISLSELLTMASSDIRSLFDIVYSFESQSYPKKIDSFEDKIIKIEATENIGVPLSISVYDTADSIIIDAAFMKGISEEVETLLDEWINKISSLVNNASDKVDEPIPRDSVKDKIISVWEQVLKIQADRNISDSTTFYDLGGNSILLFNVLRAFKEKYSINISISELLTHFSLGELSEFLKKKTISNIEKAYISKWSQYKFNLNYLLIPFSNNDFDLQKAEDSIKKVTANHRLLKSTIVCENGEFLWKEQDPNDLVIKLINIEKNTVFETLKKEVVDYFTSFQDKFLHAAYVIKHCGRVYLLWTFSHTIVDGYSLELIYNEFMRLYFYNGLSIEQECFAQTSSLRKYDHAQYIDALQNSNNFYNKYSKYITNKFLTYNCSFKKNEGYEKNKFIFQMVKKISDILNEDILFTTIVNKRFVFGEEFNTVRDLHDEMPFIYKKGKTEFFEYEEAINNIKTEFLENNTDFESPIQINYEVALGDYEESVENKPDNEIEAEINEVFEYFESQLDDNRLLSVSIVDTYNTLEIELISRFKSSVIERLIKELKEEVL